MKASKISSTIMVALLALAMLAGCGAAGDHRANGGGQPRRARR